MASVEDLRIRCDTYASYRRVRDGQGRHGYLEIRRGKLGQGGALLCGATKRIDVEAYTNSDTMMVISDTLHRMETGIPFKLNVELNIGKNSTQKSLCPYDFKPNKAVRIQALLQTLPNTHSMLAA